MLAIVFKTLVLNSGPGGDLMEARRMEARRMLASDLISRGLRSDFSWTRAPHIEADAEHEATNQLEIHINQRMHVLSASCHSLRWTHGDAEHESARDYDGLRRS